MEQEQLVRINKYLSECGFCSRREADKLLEQGSITINSIVPELGTKVGPNDVVEVNGKPKAIYGNGAYNHSLFVLNLYLCI